MTATSPEGGVLLNAEHVTKRFGGLLAINDISFDIPRGAIVSLIGPNGAGKTTFFNIIAGIYDPTKGSVAVEGRKMIAHSVRGYLEPFVWVTPAIIVAILTAGGFLATNSETTGIAGLALTLGVLTTMLISAVARPAWYTRLLGRLGIFRSARPNDMVEAGLGRTFQNIRLFQNMTAMENILVGMHIKLRANLVDAMFSTPKNRREEISSRERAAELLALVGLRNRGEDLAKNLPYGDQRRLEIARAMATRPKLLCLDEPAAGFNPAEKQRLLELIRKVRDQGITVLLIEHDMRLVMGVTDRIVVLEFGKKIAEGTPAEVRDNPAVIAAYLGVPTDAA